MNNSVSIIKGYNTQPTKKHSRLIQIKEYFQSSYDSTSSNILNESINHILSPEIDIFSMLPDIVFKNHDAKLFLDEMKKSLINWDKEELRRITLPKLQVTESTEETLVIEWIFNYFRLFFSFNQQEGAYYGEVVNDLDNGIFHNDFKKMDLENYACIAESEVAYAIMMAEGI